MLNRVNSRNVNVSLIAPIERSAIVRRATSHVCVIYATPLPWCATYARPLHNVANMFAMVGEFQVFTDDAKNERVTIALRSLQ